MTLLDFPKNINIDNKEGCLQITNESLGWHSTYVFYDYDLLNLDYFQTLKESLWNLRKKLVELGYLKEEPERISESWLKSNNYTYKEKGNCWISENKQVQLMLIPEYDEYWTVHFDNNRFESIGTLDIKYVWQLESLLEIIL